MARFLLRKPFSVVIVGCALVAAPIACSGSSGGKNDFIARYCAEFNPCCAKAGLPSDGAQCRAFLALAFSGPYDASAGDACLADLQAESSSPTFCNANASLETLSCKKVFGGGSSAPGSACTQDSECAPSPDGPVRCASVFLAGGAELKKCQVNIPGKAGDSPCVGTVRRDGSSSGSGSSDGVTDVPPRAYLCALAAGVYCDDNTHLCTAIAALGESCAPASRFSCAADAYCDEASTKCVARKPTGAPCVFGGQCVAGDTCDSKGNTCVALLAGGEPCTGSQSCASGFCTNGKCGRDSLLVFLCGGS